MANGPFEIAYRPELEDEVLLIESEGEMPEVSLADSLAHLGELTPDDRQCLARAAARRYREMVRRDLDPANRGLSHFRGLERALANLGRMECFLAGWGWVLSKDDRADLAGRLAEYLTAEARDLAQGRAYATCGGEEVLGLARSLGLPPKAYLGVLEAMGPLPLLDFMGQSALRRLSGAQGRPRRRQEGGSLYIEVLTPGGKIAAGAALSLQGPDGPDAQAQAQAELVWALVRQPRRPSS